MLDASDYPHHSSFHRPEVVVKLRRISRQIVMTMQSYAIKICDEIKAEEACKLISIMT